MNNITHDELTQKKIAFWTEWFDEQVGRDLKMVFGSIKAMTAKVYEMHGDGDDSGLYYALLLSEEKLHDVITNKIGKNLKASFDDLANHANTK